MARQKSESLGKAVPFINTLATNITKRDIQHAYQIISTVVTRMIQEAESFIHDEMKKARSDEDYRALLEAQSRVRSEAHWINDAMLNLSGLLESDVATDREKQIALHAFTAGLACMTLRIRSLEDDCVVGKERKASATSMRSSKQSFDPSRNELLKWMKQAARKYPGLNQKDLCAKVAAENGFHIGGERVRQKLRDHKITAAEYKTKDF